MSKPRNKSITYLRAGIFVSIVVFFLTLIISVIYCKYVKQEIYIPTVSEEAGNSSGRIGKGKIISQEDITFTKVGRYGILPNMITDPSVLVGKYVTRDYYSGECFWAMNLVADYPKMLSQRIRYGALAIPASLMNTENAEIMEDDFIKIDVIINKDQKELQGYDVQNTTGSLPDSGISLVHAKELQAVRVVGFCDAAGNDVTAAKMNNIMSKDSSQVQSVSPSFLILDVNEMQEALLIQGMYGGQLQIIILPEETQRKHQLAWGLIDEEGNAVDYITNNENTDELAVENSIEAAKEIEQTRMEEGTLETPDLKADQAQ